MSMWAHTQYIYKMAKIPLYCVCVSTFGNQKQSILLKNHQSYSLFESGIHIVCVRMVRCGAYMYLCSNNGFFVIGGHEFNALAYWHFSSIIIILHCTKDTRNFRSNSRSFIRQHIRKDREKRKHFQTYTHSRRINE